eukprot:GHVH01000545.1.p1 GENE.GHVH01000545.1~~GHVH01000545.1.p1  ORF type:complete len:428 (-),score=47.52 GHVH01000545.1:219-1502(-)
MKYLCYVGWHNSRVHGVAKLLLLCVAHRHTCLRREFPSTMKHEGFKGRGRGRAGGVRNRSTMECGPAGMVYPQQSDDDPSGGRNAPDVVDMTSAGEAVVIPTRIGRELVGHKGAVTRAHFTHDGLHLMSCGQDRNVILWNPYTGLQIQQFTGPHNKEITDVSIFRNKSKFVSVGGDVNAFLWDVSNRKVIRKFQGHSSKIYCSGLGNGDTILFTGSDDRTVNVWDLRQRGRPVQTFTDARDSITAIHFREMTSKLISASVDGTFREYDIRNGALVETEFHHPITSMAFTSDYDAAAISLLDGSVRLIDLMAKNDQVNAFSSKVPAIYRHQVIFDPNDAKLLQGTEDGRLISWDIDCRDPYRFTEVTSIATKSPLFHVEFAPERPVTDLGVRVTQKSPYPAYVTCSMEKSIQVYFEEIDEEETRVIGI